MRNGYPADFLMIRNQISIEKVIVNLLNMEMRHTSKWLRFRCPLCYNFHTPTNRNTNLARCFDCKENFNPIDLVVVIGIAASWRQWNISRKECYEKPCLR